MVKAPRRPCKPKGCPQLLWHQKGPEPADWLACPAAKGHRAEWESNDQTVKLSGRRDKRGQIKCVTAGTQVRRRANTCTHLLPRSIVPGASVSSSAGLDSQGFLIGQAGPGRHPVTSPPVVHGDIPLAAEGGGCARKAVLVLNKGLGASQLRGWALGASHTPHRWSPPPSHLCVPPRWDAGHPAVGSSLPPPPSRGLLHSPPGAQT